MRSVNWMTVCGVTVMAALCAGCGPNILKGQDPALEGTWAIIDEFADEQEEPADLGTFTITQNQISVGDSVLQIGGIYGVDATRNPKQIDIFVDNFSGGLEAFLGNVLVGLLAFNDLRVLEGIYEVDENHLRMFLAPRIFGRPGSFPSDDSGMASGQFQLRAIRVE